MLIWGSYWRPCKQWFPRNQCFLCEWFQLESARVNCGLGSWTIEKLCIIMNHVPFLFSHFRIFILLITKRLGLEMAILHGLSWSEFLFSFESLDWYNSTNFSASKSDHTGFFPPSSPPLTENTSISSLWLCNSERSKAVSFKLGSVVVFPKKEKSWKIWRINLSL